MTKAEGVTLTQKWIEQNDVKDGSGRQHYHHGIWTSVARLTVYVLFDLHPVHGRKVYYFFTHRLQLLAQVKWAEKVRVTYGGIESASTSGTGAGYLFSPSQTFIDRIEEVPAEIIADDAKTAVAIVSSQLSARRLIGRIREANKAEQRDGLDLSVSDPIRRYGSDPFAVEVKSRRRHQSFGELFLQVSETNPDKRI